MKDMDIEAVIAQLNEILEFELAGVVRYTHYALMVTGPYRLPIVTFFQNQATEALRHAQAVGEVLTGLEGHPSLKVAPIEETNNHTLKEILAESLYHEKQAVRLYRGLLELVGDRSIYLEEFARSMIGSEERHNMELRKMLRDFGGSDPLLA